MNKYSFHKIKRGDYIKKKFWLNLQDLEQVV